MKFDQGIELIRTALQHPLPGEEAQRLMAPATRKTFEELMASVEDFRESSVMMLLYPDDRGILHTLMIKRPGGDSVHSGQIAFPGGKVEPGEDPRDALVRELDEELGITCDVGAPVEVTYHRYPEKAVLLLFFEARRRPGSAEPHARDVADVRWSAAADLHDPDFPPADVPVLARVRAILARGGAAAEGER